MTPSCCYGDQEAIPEDLIFDVEVTAFEETSGMKVEYVSNRDLLSLQDTSTLEDGEKFDSSYDRSEPFIPQFSDQAREEGEFKQIKDNGKKFDQDTPNRG